MAQRVVGELGLLEVGTALGTVWKIPTSILLCLAPTKPAPSNPRHSVIKLLAMNCHPFHHPRLMLPNLSVLPGTPRASAIHYVHTPPTTLPTQLRSTQPWPLGVVSMDMLRCDVSAGAIVV